MKQYETIKMSPRRAVDTILWGKSNCTPEVWKAAKKMVKTLAESATPMKPVISEDYTYFRCPACDAKITSHEYCQECGQAIKW